MKLFTTVAMACVFAVAPVIASSEPTCASWQCALSGATRVRLALWCGDLSEPARKTLLTSMILQLDRLGVVAAAQQGSPRPTESEPFILVTLGSRVIDVQLLGQPHAGLESIRVPQDLAGLFESESRLFCEALASAWKKRKGPAPHSAEPPAKSN